MTTTSLHGSSSSFIALKKEKKDNKNPPRLAIASEGVGCRRCHGCRRRQTTTTSLHGSSSSLAFVDLKKKMIKTHPVSQLQARGWVVVVVVGADGGRRRQRAYMACRRRRRSLT